MNGEKLWCTNGLKAGVLVVMAQTPPKMVNGKERKQITAFIVEVNTPGLAMPHRCHFMGLRALYNGVVTFKDVRVPRENIIAGEGQGSEGRAHHPQYRPPNDSCGVRRFVQTAARNFAASGPPSGCNGARPIGQHYAIAGKIAEMAGNTFAMEAITFLTSALVDRKGERSADRNRDVQDVGDGDDLENRGRRHASARRSRLRNRAVAARARR